MNQIGSLLLPRINQKLSQYQTFEYSDPSFLNGTGFYPGQEACAWCPHAKWHLQSGIALVDLVFLGDELFNVMQTYQQ